MITVRLEAIKDGEGTESLIIGLRRLVSGNPFRELEDGRWAVVLPESVTENQARTAIESQLDRLAYPGDWRERLRLTTADSNGGPAPV